jgi:hypothetical protein
MNNFYSSHGILHQTSCVESPQQNRRLERKQQHVSLLPLSFLQTKQSLKVFGSLAYASTFLIPLDYSRSQKILKPRKITFI